MGDGETLARDTLEVITGQLVGRREGDGMDNDVESVPAAAQCLEQGVDLLVTADIAGQHDIRITLLCHLFNAWPEFFVRVAECQLGAFPAHGLRDTPGDRPVAGQPDNECAFSAQESHSCILKLRNHVPVCSGPPGP